MVSLGLSELIASWFTIPVSVIGWSSHMSQCLRNNWVTRRGYTLVHFTIQTPLRMHKTPPDVTLAGAWNNLTQEDHWDRCHYIGHPWHIGLHWWDCCRYAPSHHQPPIWLEYGYDGATDIMLQPLKKRLFKRGQEVDNPLVSLVSVGSLFDDDNALCDIDDLSMKTRLSTRLIICMKTSLQTVNLMEIAILFVGKWNDIKSLQEKMR